MNQSQAPKPKTTLLEALTWDTSKFEIEMECANARDFDFSTQERISTSALWLHLTGIEPGSALETIAVGELLTNPDLFVKLNGPAREFVDWFRREAWDDFDLSDAAKSEAWACGVLDRSRAMCTDMGALALQMPLRL